MFHNMEKNKFLKLMINKRLGLTKCYALMRSEISLRLFTYSFSGSLYLSLKIYSINPINHLFIFFLPVKR